MRVSDMMHREGRVFLKSEVDQVGDNWPCLSFGKSKKRACDRFSKEFELGRDVVVFVGTSKKNTQNPKHRSRLISAFTVDPREILETSKIVPTDEFAAKGSEPHERWPYSFKVVDAANMIGPPYRHARDVIPKGYGDLGKLANFGDVVEAEGAERDAVMGLEVTPVKLNYTKSARNYLDGLGSPRGAIGLSMEKEANRVVQLIIDRVKRGGKTEEITHPLRSAPDTNVLKSLIISKFREQSLKCALCGGGFDFSGKNGMLQLSADRIDSKNGAYDSENIELTHLACNLAKNRFSSGDFEKWLSVIRGAGQNASD